MMKKINISLKRTLAFTLALMMVLTALPIVSGLSDAAASGDRVYLESDIFAESFVPDRDDRPGRKHPADGSFIMGGNTYFTGISVRNDTGGTATYEVSGRGFVRLSGTIGHVRGTTDAHTAASMTVTCADSGRFLGSGEVRSGAPPQRIDIDITGVHRVNIRLRSGTSLVGGAGFGFGAAYFSSSAAPSHDPAPPPPPPPVEPPPQQQVSVSVSNRFYWNTAGWGTASGGGRFNQGDTVTLRAVALYLVAASFPQVKSLHSAQHQTAIGFLLVGM